MTTLTKGLLALTLLPVFSSAANATITTTQSFYSNDTPHSSYSAGVANTFGAQDAGFSFPNPQVYPNDGNHYVDLTFSAYATGSNPTARVKLMGTNRTTNQLQEFVSWAVGSQEQRFSFHGTIGSNIAGLGVYFTSSSQNVVVREFRAGYSPQHSAYNSISSQILYYSTLVDKTINGTPLTTWPQITNGTNSGVGISGTITANDARGNTVDHVWVSIQRSSDGKWWNGNAWQTAYFRHAAPHIGFNWSMNQVPTGSNLLDGDYHIIASTHDQADSNFTNTYHTSFEREIDVAFAAPTTPTPTPTPAGDTIAPNPSPLTNPANGSTIGSIGSLSGTASDNPGGSGIKAVRVHLLYEGNPLLSWNWITHAWQTGFTIDSSTLYNAPLGNNGTTWSVPSSALPRNQDAGRYTVRTFTDDNAGHNDVYGAYGFTTMYSIRVISKTGTASSGAVTSPSAPSS